MTATSATSERDAIARLMYGAQNNAGNRVALPVRMYTKLLWSHLTLISNIGMLF